ncbi:MAG: M23 family metallopeptidase [Faecalibacterium sp.]|jgi:murein DD-endopeptidase MepM/ murein hydrolase activator NlpD|nr:M23 family metallopeptidase [Faecalibacterium sp.]
MEDESAPKKTEPQQKRAQGGVGIVPLQVAIVAALLGGLLLCRSVLPGVYAAAAEEYEICFEQEDLTPELARFAGAVLDQLTMPVSAAQAAPFGCSNDSYVPKQAFVQPVLGYTLSSGYGWRKHPITKKKAFHDGVDLACAEGTPILAAIDGIVDYTLYSASGGNSVRLRHADGVVTGYCHMQYTFVRPGEQVKAGQVIGTAGSTGNATGPHLHFSLLYNDCYYDPSEMLGLS